MTETRFSGPMTPSSLWSRFDLALKIIMAALLFAMMTITTADVIGRYLLNAPVPGGFEIVQYLMAVVVFASLPLTTAADHHLTVSLVGGWLKGRVRRVHRVFVLAFSSLALVTIAWRMAEQAAILARSQQISGFLELPLAPVAWVMSVLAALAAVIVLVKFTGVVLGREPMAAALTPAALD
jgi:TRAP-type C4-dicarboxylate transport system permease small subunit